MDVGCSAIPSPAADGAKAPAAFLFGLLMSKIKPSDAETSDGARDEPTNELRPLEGTVT